MERKGPPNKSLKIQPYTHSSIPVIKIMKKKFAGHTHNQKIKSPRVAKQSQRSIVWTTSYGHYKCLFIYF